MAGELADHLDRLAGFGEVGTERMAQDVRGAAVLGELGKMRVAGDDPGHVAGSERLGVASGPRQRDEQLLVRADGPRLDTGGDRIEGVVLERDGAATAALAVADCDPPRGRMGNRTAQPPIVRAPALATSVSSSA